MSWHRFSLTALCVPAVLAPAACFQVPDIDDTDAASSSAGESTTEDPVTTTMVPTTTGQTTTGLDSSSGDVDAVCGDGIVADAEACDDSNVADGDGCTSACLEETGFSCNGEPSVCTSTCGDGVLASDEICDDGNNFDNDGCTACTVDEGFECTGRSPSSCSGICGDSLMVGDETCDDGGGVDGDGCSSQCTVELYYRCVSLGPGSCAPIRILYAPAWSDDEAFRDSVAAITGGVVDYFDVQNGTPILPDLTANYDCIHTFPNVPYADGATFGSHLANFVDFGGNVVLGAITPFPAAELVGTPIMEPEYSPVAPTTNVFGISESVAYTGDATSILVQDVVEFGLGLAMDENPVLQGAGIMDGTYDNGMMAIAHRPDFKVVYLNGVGAGVLQPTGNWPVLTANACGAGFVQ